MEPRLGIVHYGAGNVGNLKRGLARIGHDATVLASPADVGAMDLLLLPGVGAFPPAMRRLQEMGWFGALLEWAADGKPLLGICLGMQLLTERSLEDGQTLGLGLLRGMVEELPIRKIPHMGWNDLVWFDEGMRRSLTRGASPCFYFVHSFALLESPDGMAACEVEGVRFAAFCQRGAVAGCQFHPERSGPEGLAFLKRLIDQLLEEGAP